MVQSNSQRTSAALPQIASLNSNVQLTAFPTLEPFVSVNSNQANMVEFLQREKVDIIVGCDLTRSQMAWSGFIVADRIGTDRHSC